MAPWTYQLLASAVWATLWLTPVAAFSATRLLARVPRLWQWGWFLGLLACVGCVAAALWHGVATPSLAANALLVCLAYGAWGVLALSLFGVRPRWLGALVGTLAALPLLGGLWAALAIGSRVAFLVMGPMSPAYVEPAGPGLGCQIWVTDGEALPEGRVHVTVSRALPWVPWLNQEVYRDGLYGPDIPISEAATCALARDIAERRLMAMPTSRP